MVILGWLLALYIQLSRSKTKSEIKHEGCQNVLDILVRYHQIQYSIQFICFDVLFLMVFQTIKVFIIRFGMFSLDARMLKEWWNCCFPVLWSNSCK